MAARGPRLVLLALLAALACTLAALTAPAVASPAAAPALVTLQSGVLDDLNQIRVLNGLAPLKLSAPLTASAAQHSREMADRGYFEHASADGTVFWKRIARWYGATGFSYWSVGENLLWSSPDVDATGALRMWMNSPEHKRNILNPSWREIGISAVHLSAAPGTYRDLPVTIITTDFGVRRS